MEKADKSTNQQHAPFPLMRNGAQTGKPEVF